jgi:hypothetical protein
MESKSLIYLGLFIGSTVGSYVPTLWGAGFLSFSSVICSAIGGILGIYIFFKISQ